MHQPLLIGWNFVNMFFLFVKLTFFILFLSLLFWITVEKGIVNFVVNMLEDEKGIVNFVVNMLEDSLVISTEYIKEYTFHLEVIVLYLLTDLALNHLIPVRSITQYGLHTIK